MLFTSDNDCPQAVSSRVSNLMSYETEPSAASRINPPRPSTDSPTFRFPLRSLSAFLSTSTGLIIKSEDANLFAFHISDFSILARPLNPGSASCSLTAAWVLSIASLLAINIAF